MKKYLFSLAATLTIYSFLLSSFTFAQSSQMRNMSSFKEVHVSGGFDVVLTKGNTESVNIESSNIDMDKIITEVEGSKLKIYLKKGNYRSIDVKLTVTYKDIEAIHSSGSSEIVCKSDIKASNFSLHNSGSGNVKLASLNADNFEVHNSGSSNIDVAGTAKRQSYQISGSSRINAYDLKSEEAKVSISGSGDVHISVSQNLEASVSGSGDIRYKGDPSIRNVRVSGSGNISKAN
jgi:hypothetical protein